MIQTICQMVDSCRSIKTCPPSAIATAQAKQSHDDLQRSGRISHVGLRLQVWKKSLLNDGFFA